jgi:hypothetical protein
VDIFAPLFLLLPLGLCLYAVGSRKNRSVWSQIRPWQYGVFTLLAPAGVAVSLFHFTAIDNHAWRPHEESLWFALRGDADSDGIPDAEDPDIDGDGSPNDQDELNDSYHPLQTQPLIRWIYSRVGVLVGADPRAGKNSWDELKHAFMGTALLLGMWAATLLAITGQLLTGRFWIGLGAGLLLVFHPTLSYWRINAFHVAVSHVAFSATLLAAVLVSQKPRRANYAAWFTLGALCLYLRSEQAGAVAATAAVPLLCSGTRATALLRAWRTWAPGLAASAALLIWPSWTVLRLAAEREDYRTGLRFGAIHLGVPEVWEPMWWPGFAFAIVLGLSAAVLPAGRSPDSLRLPARALVIVTVAGVLPTLFFTSFGSRHLLNSSSAAALLALIGLALIPTALFGAHRKLGLGVAAALALGCLGPTLLSSWAKLAEWGPRYHVSHPRPPTLPDTARPPERAPQFDTQRCASYAAAWQLCNQETWTWCHPPKDLRDPVLVRARWDQFDGCVVWGVDERDAEVAGTRHEWWMVVRDLYRWEPLGVIVLDDNGLHPRIDVYRMKERP